MRGGTWSISGTTRCPTCLLIDNDSEISGLLLDLRAYHHKTNIDFSRPSTPTNNSHIKTFNGAFCDEYVNVDWFETLAEAKETIEAWRTDYSKSRPHTSLNDMTPATFARQTAIQGHKLSSKNVKDFSQRNSNESMAM